MATWRIGIDEAGRGAALGVLAVVAFAVREDELPTLKKHGIKDSKRLTPGGRQRCVSQLRTMQDAGVVHYAVTVATPAEIDHYVTTGNRLNLLEIEKMCKALRLVVDLIPSNATLEVIIDSCEANCAAFREKVMAILGPFEGELRCENRADSNHLEAAAASILAKVQVDQYAIHAIPGAHGSVYPSHPDVLRFADAAPNEVRRSWSTFKYWTPPATILPQPVPE